MDKFEKRCELCNEMFKKDNKCYCHECFDVEIHEVDDCPFGADSDELEVLDKKAKSVKHYEKADKERKKTTKERKIDNDKLEILEIVQKALIKEMKISANIEKEIAIHFQYKDNEYSLKLIKHRLKK